MRKLIYTTKTAFLARFWYHNNLLVMIYSKISSLYILGFVFFTAGLFLHRISYIGAVLLIPTTSVVYWYNISPHFYMATATTFAELPQEIKVAPSASPLLSVIIIYSLECLSCLINYNVDSRACIMLLG